MVSNAFVSIWDSQMNSDASSSSANAVLKKQTSKHHAMTFDVSKDDSSMNMLPEPRGRTCTIDVTKGKKTNHYKKHGFRSSDYDSLVENQRRLSALLDSTSMLPIDQPRRQRASNSNNSNKRKRLMGDKTPNEKKEKVPSSRDYEERKWQAELNGLPVIPVPMQ